MQVEIDFQGEEDFSEEEEQEEGEYVNRGDNEPVIFGFYSALYNCFDDLMDTIEKKEETLMDLRKTIIGDNFETRTNRYVPLDILVNRFQQLKNCLDPLRNAIRISKREIRTLDRYDTEIFYPDNFEKFKEHTYANLVSKTITLKESPPILCIICKEEKTDTVRIIRKCITCEGAECECKELSMCVKCSMLWYWTQSKKMYKSFSTCPCCRAEYCLEDLVTLRLGSLKRISSEENPEAKKQKIGNE